MENLGVRERYGEVLPFPAWIQGLGAVALLSLVAGLVVLGVAADGG